MNTNKRGSSGPDSPVMLHGLLPTSAERASAHAQGGNGEVQETDRWQVPRHRFMTPSERAVLAHRIGGTKSPESQSPCHPANTWLPSKGMPRGLYKDVVLQRAKFYYLFHSISIFRWSLMVAQLCISAALTALGSRAAVDGTSITVLGAAGTIIAGLLGLLHNSGLPDRYRYDMKEYEEVEDHIKELLDTGIAPANQDIEEILAECFDLYREAKATISANMPVTYNKNLGRGSQVKTPVRFQPGITSDSEKPGSTLEKNRAIS